MRFRKRPVVIEAERYHASHPQDAINALKRWGARFSYLSGLVAHPGYPESASSPRLAIVTLEGEMTVSDGDWIIQGVQGEVYPCKPDIFAATYEPAS